jgi:four helix bundle protein
MVTNHQFSFEKLRVWQDARSWVSSIYEMTSRFPPKEAHNLTSQLNRASVSGAANMAEGSARISMKGQTHFSQIAYGSLMEAACLILLASDLSLILPEQLVAQRKKIAGLSNQINALRQTQIARANL